MSRMHQATPWGKPLINQLDLFNARFHNPPSVSAQHAWRRSHPRHRRHSMRLAPLALASLALFAGSAIAQTQPVIGLVTKTDTNPFFVKMKEGAAEAAKAQGAKLMTGSGKADGDNAGQVTAMENMIAAGAKTILITPND